MKNKLYDIKFTDEDFVEYEEEIKKLDERYNEIIKNYKKKHSFKNFVLKKISKLFFRKHKCVNTYDLEYEKQIQELTKICNIANSKDFDKYKKEEKIAVKMHDNNFSSYKINRSSLSAKA